MSTVLRQALSGAVALVVLCFASPMTVQADHGRGWGHRGEWRAYEARPHYYYYEPGHSYSEPGYDYYVYPRYRWYYGTPAYGYYWSPWDGSAVRPGSVHVWR